MTRHKRGKIFNFQKGGAEKISFLDRNIDPCLIDYSFLPDTSFILPDTYSCLADTYSCLADTYSCLADT
jgi:hypothetical protein